MKYTIKLLNTATESVSRHVVEVGENEPAEDAALDFAVRQGADDKVTYLVVGIERGDN